MLALTACDHARQVESPVSDEHVTLKSEKEKNNNAEGKRLTEVAGQATIPTVEQKKVENIIPKIAEPFVGRYKTIVSCDDPIVFCKEGTADFILNLLPDGTAHRTITYLGKITFASDKQYRQDRWLYDEKSHEIILSRASGVEFFYNIDQDKKLTMNLTKIANATETNRQFFAEGNPFPQKAYVLTPEK